MSNARQKAKRNRRSALAKVAGLPALRRPMTDDEEREARAALREEQRRRVGGEGMSILDKRCAYMGWNNGPDSLRRARNPMLGTLHGQLAYTKIIPQSAYQGLEAYLTMEANYHRAIDAPSQHAQAVSIGGVSGTAPKPERVDVVRRVVNEWMKMQGAIQVGRVDVGNMRRVVMGDMQHDTFAAFLNALGEGGIKAVSDAGGVLCGHFGLAVEKT